MGKLQDTLADTQKAMSEQQMGALQERLTMLATELERTRTERPEPVSATATAKQSIQDARELLELLAPPQAPPPPPVKGGDAQLQAWMLRAQLDQKRWEADREDRHTETMARLELERDTKRAELEIQAAHDLRMSRFFDETAPKLIDVGQRLLDSFVNNNAATAAPVGSVAATPQAAAQVKVPAGYESGNCVQCQHAIFYKVEWGEVVCQTCGAVYTLTVDEAPSAAGGRPSDRYHTTPAHAETERQAIETDEGANIG
jgi:hypothetical protein